MEAAPHPPILSLSPEVDYLPSCLALALPSHGRKLKQDKEKQHFDSCRGSFWCKERSNLNSLGSWVSSVEGRVLTTGQPVRAGTSFEQHVIREWLIFFLLCCL